MTEQEVDTFLSDLDKEHPWEKVEERGFPEAESCEALGYKYKDDYEEGDSV